MNERVHYHLLDDNIHEICQENRFLEDTKTSGYLFLYSRAQPHCFNVDPYFGQSTLFNSLKDQTLHHFRKRNVPRQVKRARLSDMPMAKESMIPLSQVLKHKKDKKVAEKIIIEESELIDNKTFCFVNAYKITNSVQTINSLRPYAWVNDNVVNYVLGCLSHSHPRPECLIIDSICHMRVRDTDGGFDMLKKMIVGKLDLTLLQKVKSLRIFIPLNVMNGKHWALAILQVFDGNVKYFDSIENNRLSPDDCSLVHDIFDVVVEKIKEVNNEYWTDDIQELDVQTVVGIPSQTNGYDCGLYTALFAKCQYFNETMCFGSKFVSKF